MLVPTEKLAPDVAQLQDFAKLDRKANQKRQQQYHVYRGSNFEVEENPDIHATKQQSKVSQKQNIDEIQAHKIQYLKPPKPILKNDVL